VGSEVTSNRADLAHRIGIWGFAVAMGLYLLNIGQWVGAADEKLRDAETVEEKQQTIIETQTTIKTKQEAIVKQLDEIEEQMKEDKKEILAAIRDLEKND
jgi:uncharacterized membrane protein (DUF106 family)